MWCWYDGFQLLYFFLHIRGMKWSLLWPATWDLWHQQSSVLGIKTFSSPHQKTALLRYWFKILQMTVRESKILYIRLHNKYNIKTYCIWVWTTFKVPCLVSFKVWNLTTETVCYHSFVLSGKMLVFKILVEQIHLFIISIFKVGSVYVEYKLATSIQMYGVIFKLVRVKYKWYVFYNHFCRWVKTFQNNWKYCIVCHLAKSIFFNCLASPLLSVVFLEENRHVIFGSTDGQVSDAPPGSSKSVSEMQSDYTCICLV